MKFLFVYQADTNPGFKHIMHLRGMEMASGLRDYGIEVLTVDRESAQICALPLYQEVKAFKPTHILVESLSYYLGIINVDGNLLGRFQLPTYVFWDDPFGALTNGVLSKCRGGVSKVLARNNFTRRIGSLFRELLVENPLDVFRSVMSNKLVTHLCWDTGHASVMKSLGITNSNILFYPLTTYSPFLEHGKLNYRGDPTIDISFCGNIYSGALRDHLFWKDRWCRKLIENTCRLKSQSLDKSVWELLIRDVSSLGWFGKRFHGLDPKDPFFWELYVLVAWLAVNTIVRIDMLSSLNRPVDLFGVFSDKNGLRDVRASNINYRGYVDHFSELPAVYSSTKINVCISNGLIYHGIPSKFLDCVASGGFGLVDPKDDLLALFGNEIATIFFRDATELRNKVEYFISRPHERKEIISTLQAKIWEKCTIRSFVELLVGHIEK
ncbi:MAG: glycosyltransferase [Pseudomonadota bacterium]